MSQPTLLAGWVTPGGWVVAWRIPATSKPAVANAVPLSCSVLQTSFQLNESAYSAGELSGSWVMRLAAALEVQLQWLQPLLTLTCCEAFTLTLLDKLVAMIEVLLGRKVRQTY